MQAIGKRAQQQKTRFAGSSLYGVKMKFFKKSRVLAGLLDKFGGGGGDSETTTIGHRHKGMKPKKDAVPPCGRQVTGEG